MKSKLGKGITFPNFNIFAPSYKEINEEFEENGNKNSQKKNLISFFILIIFLILIFFISLLGYFSHKIDEYIHQIIITFTESLKANNNSL